MTSKKGRGVSIAIEPPRADEPGTHVNYSETKLPIRDGCSSSRTFPADLVGQELKWSNSLVRLAISSEVK
jgi:hypothetical protein